MAGGTPKFVPLRPVAGRATSSAEWVLDMNELEAAITSKTKMIIVNTPQNIPGKVYTRNELESIAEFAKKHNLIVIADEVYEPMVYDHNTHVKIATLPGMWERTITLGSAGKSFSVTGWKVYFYYVISRISFLFHRLAGLLVLVI
jgi:aspartate/methionine/tyrosine aminotransferase